MKFYNLRNSRCPAHTFPPAEIGQCLLAGPHRIIIGQLPVLQNDVKIFARFTTPKDLCEIFSLTWPFVIVVILVFAVRHFSRLINLSVDMDKYGSSVSYNRIADHFPAHKSIEVVACNMLPICPGLLNSSSLPAYLQPKTRSSRDTREVPHPFFVARSLALVSIRMTIKRCILCRPRSTYDDDIDEP